MEDVVQGKQTSVGINFKSVFLSIAIQSGATQHKLYAWPLNIFGRYQMLNVWDFSGTLTNGNKFVYTDNVKIPCRPITLLYIPW